MMKRISNKTMLVTSFISGLAIGVTTYFINRSIDKTTDKDAFEQVKRISFDIDIPEDFRCLGKLENVYPELSEVEKTNWYRTYVWENDKGLRFMTWDLGNSRCDFMCEGTISAFRKYIKKHV